MLVCRTPLWTSDSKLSFSDSWTRRSTCNCGGLCASRCHLAAAATKAEWTVCENEQRRLRAKIVNSSSCCLMRWNKTSKRKTVVTAYLCRPNTSPQVDENGSRQLWTLFHRRSEQSNKRKSEQPSYKLAWRQRCQRQSCLAFSAFLMCSPWRVRSKSQIAAIWCQ